MSIQTPFQRLFASTGLTTATANHVTNSNAAMEGLWVSWPELNLSGTFANVNALPYVCIYPFTKAIASLDRGVLRCLFSLSTNQRRGLWVTLFSTGLFASVYMGYAYVWPCLIRGVDTYGWTKSVESIRLTLLGRTHARATASSTPISRVDNVSPSEERAPVSPDVSLSNTNNTDSQETDNSATSTITSALSMSLPGVFQRALDAVRSHQLTSKSATATTVLLERQGHQWFTTLREHMDAGAAIVGISVRVPATLLLAPTDEVVTLNRWLEVDVRRAPPSDSPVCLWNNDVGNTSDTDVDSGYAHPANEDAPGPLDGLYLSALLRDVVSHQFERQHQPLPALQYRVHNQLCAPEHAQRYGLEIATIVAGVVCGCALVVPTAESALTTHTSLTSWAASDVGPRCEREWEAYAGERIAAAKETETKEAAAKEVETKETAADGTQLCANDGADSPSLPSLNEITRSPLSVQSRIAAALWESESDEEEETLSDKTDTCDDVPPVTVPNPVRQPVVVCGQLQWTPHKDAADEIHRDTLQAEWPADAIAQTLVKHLEEVLRPASPSRPKIHINGDGELYVLSHVPVGLTVKQLLVQACEANGCTLQLHCLARVYRAGTAATCKVRQTWVSSVELV